VSGADVRPDRHALLEFDALLTEIIALRDEGDGDRFEHDHRYRWVLHRLWIAAGNEALAYTTAIGRQLWRWSRGTTCTGCVMTLRTNGCPISMTASSAGSRG
jgi:hypothetical protein